MRVRLKEKVSHQRRKKSHVSHVHYELPIVFHEMCG